MRKLAFLITLLGISTLALLVLFQPPLKISSQKDLTYLEDNQKVSVSGKVIDEKVYSDSRTLVLEKNLTLYCSCKNIPPLKGKEISAIGLIDTYQKTKVSLLSIKW